jgi:D-alanyl-D-alanine carboxypeptidase/D-alanyl-D-alanine-endopeptidase (penicillin-binding protein 4)
MFLFNILIILMLESCGQKPEKKPVEMPENRNDILSGFTKQEALRNASLGIMAMDLRTGTILLELNSQTSLVPASTQKILISAAALEAMGPDHRFKTSLEYDGFYGDNGVVHGNLYLRGEGDPAFASPLFGNYYGDVFDRFGDAIINAGITEIDGNVVGDASIFGERKIPGTWVWEDIGNYYGATAGGLNIYDNSYKVLLKTPNKAGSQAKIIKIDPPMPWLEFDNQVVAANDNRDNAYIYGSLDSEKRIIRGTLPKGRNEFIIKGSIPDPALLAANELINGLKRNRTRVDGKAETLYQKTSTKERKSITEVVSPPLTEIVTQLNHRSINLYAETLLLHLARIEGGYISTFEGCNSLKSFWKAKGMNVEGMFLEDASGLSRYNALSVDKLVFVLDYMKNKSSFSGNFVNSLPIAGVSGSLENFGKGTILENNFRAKSGYMSRVMGYAGYLTTASGKEIAIAVLVNNYPCTNAEMRKMLEELLVSVAGI